MDSRVAIITFLEPGENYPSQGLPGIPVYPSNDLPGRPNRPSNDLPQAGHISLLPVYPFDPTIPSNELPGGGQINNDLPIRPGRKYVVKWIACHGLILVPDNSLPGSGEDEAQPR